jgi:hypothetical protein
VKITPKLLKVENEPGLVRDTSSNAILATSLDQKRAHIESQKREANISRIGEMNCKIEKLEKSLGDIKSMLEKLINNNVSL